MRWKAVGLVALVSFKRGAVGDVVTFARHREADLGMLGSGPTA